MCWSSTDGARNEGAPASRARAWIEVWRRRFVKNILFAFQILPQVLIFTVLVALFWHWRILPFFVRLMGLLLSLLCLWLNATVSPRSKGELKVMLYETFKEDPLRLLDTGVVHSPMTRQRNYIESMNSDESLQ